MSEWDEIKWSLESGALQHHLHVTISIRCIWRNTFSGFLMSHQAAYGPSPRFGLLRSLKIWMLLVSRTDGHRISWMGSWRYFHRFMNVRSNQGLGDKGMISHWHQYVNLLMQSDTFHGLLEWK